MTDIVGVLESVDVDSRGLRPDRWVVRRRDGTTKQIEGDQIVTAKVVPATTARLRRARDVSVAELEQIAAAGWLPLERDRLGDWVLRAAEGFTGRANSVLPLGAPGVELDEALARVSRWYEDRGLPARFQVPMPYADKLDEALSARGWRAYNPTLVLVADLEQVRITVGDHPGLPSVDLAEQPNDQWRRVYTYRGQPLPSIASEVMTNAEHPVFASVREPGRNGESTVAVARAAITGQWVGITAVDVLAPARRRGLATHLMTALFDYAHGHGVRHVYLQVAEDNAAARAMYDHLGFAHHHRYHYRQDPTAVGVST